MILGIRIENFYSIKDEISLDFRAEKINTEGVKALSANVIDYKGQKVLKSIGLFGANASGKSNILKAIWFCCYTILNSHQYNEGKIFKFVPFKFEGYINKPSSFSIDFIHDDIEYEYSFTLTTTEILKESLFFYPNNRRAKVFIRDETKGLGKQEIYSFSNGLIPRPFDVAINTSKKTLFLSRASQMDREFCRNLYRFFLDNFWLGFAPINYEALASYMTKDLFIQNKELFLHALLICDSDILNIDVLPETKKVQDQKTNDKFITASENKETEFSPPRFEAFHRASPTVAFNMLSEESAGTIQLFNMLFFLLDIVKNGKTFFLDEFDLSLHSKIADFVVDLFHASSSAQFLFTSHNTNLIDAKRFRRDQILFTNKKNDGSTELYSLYDHKDFRENMDAEKGYLQGRFDAIPVVDSSHGALTKLLENTKPA